MMHHNIVTSALAVIFCNPSLKTDLGEASKTNGIRCQSKSSEAFMMVPRSVSNILGNKIDGMEIENHLSEYIFYEKIKNIKII